MGRAAVGTDGSNTTGSSCAFFKVSAANFSSRFASSHATNLRPHRTRIDASDRKRHRLSRTSLLIARTMATATSESKPTLMELYDNGGVFWSVPQQVHFNMVPRMDMSTFPFDSQKVTFTLGPWTNSIETQNTSFYLNSEGTDDPKLFIEMQGDTSQLDSTGSSQFLDSTYTKRSVVDFIATEEWQYKSNSAIRHEDSFPCCPYKFVTLQGIISLRRYSNFYVKFGVLPQILMTCFGLVAAAFRGHRTGNVTFIAGTGFTVALALMAHAVFFVDDVDDVDCDDAGDNRRKRPRDDDGAEKTKKRC